MMSVRFVSRFRKVYGPIFSLKLGSWKTIVAGSQEAIKEVLITKSTDFAGRPQFRSFLELTFGKSRLQFRVKLKIAAKRTNRARTGMGRGRKSSHNNCAIIASQAKIN